MSGAEEKGISPTSSWTHLPLSVLHTAAALLARDGVASVAKVWPEAVQDQSLKLFVSGGMPICAVCWQRVIASSLPAFFPHRSEQTCTIYIYLKRVTSGAICLPAKFELTWSLCS